ncbi:MAG TPA: hypothetical protein DCS93_13390 [Microscillaceae bacterium]|nr:hypothetical protein [Microscillaceae bacterium]
MENKHLELNSLKFKKSDYKLIGGYLLTVTFWLVYKFKIEGYALREYFIDIPVALIQVVVLLLIAKKLIEYYFIRKGSLILFIIIGFLSLWFIGFCTMLSGDYSSLGRIPWSRYSPFTKTVIFNVQNSIYNIALPLSLISGKKYYEHQLSLSRLINAQMALELKVLRSQFDPHFLYNSLNTIDALIDYSSPEEIKQYIANLASLYRYLVNIREEEIVKLEDEIALGKNYLFLTETQFENDYDVHFRLDNLPSNRYLPNGAFLTTIENVVKHNKASRGIKIKVEISITPDTLCIKNTKSPGNKKREKPVGTGLENLQKQYQLLSNEQIIIQDTQDSYTICLPLLSIVNEATQ